MVDEADVRQDGYIDYICRYSFIDIFCQIIYFRVQQIFNWKRGKQEETDNK